ncbi:MAG TPA: helicase, partial [bacterium (Candidatus Stahlbacteria)]|nr:helicase [Candidatus Stahlbacteria bacterium]
MGSDLTFITNEPGHTLKERFETLIKDCRFFDCLVAYFYASGFYQVYNALENTENIRVLIGVGMGKRSFDLMQRASSKQQSVLQFSHAETKQVVEDLIAKEFVESEDARLVEEGVQKFIEWLKSKKMEIRAYPS